jgi:transposase-like protein
MSTSASLPKQTARISDEVQAEIVRLAIRQVPHVEIGRRLNIHRQTVKRVLTRTRAALAISHDTEQERGEAVEVYRQIQAEAWRAVEQGKLGALAEVRMSQQRIDALLGLPLAGPEDPQLQLQRFKSEVVAAIRAEAPDVGPRIAQRLIAINRQEQ